MSCPLGHSPQGHHRQGRVRLTPASGSSLGSPTWKAKSWLRGLLSTDAGGWPLPSVTWQAAAGAWSLGTPYLLPGYALHAVSLRRAGPWKCLSPRSQVSSLWPGQEICAWAAGLSLATRGQWCPRPVGASEGLAGSGSYLCPAGCVHPGTDTPTCSSWARWAPGQGLAGLGATENRRPGRQAGPGPSMGSMSLWWTLTRHTSGQQPV